VDYALKVMQITQSSVGQLPVESRRHRPEQVQPPVVLNTVGQATMVSVGINLTSKVQGAAVQCARVSRQVCKFRQ
jgi:hypothetical protein